MGTPNRGRILYQGPSELDGKPIVAIVTFGSSNAKTGNVAQVWIMRSDIGPIQAAQAGADESVCGDCPQRRVNGGACYVDLPRAPNSVWRAYRSGSYRVMSEADRARLSLAPIRLGAYGDPAAVPFAVWEDLISQGCGAWTGYTHQWRRAPQLRALVMASCDTPAEHDEARALGWRTFTIMPEGAERLDGAVQCLADARDLTCSDCGICDGTRADSRSRRAPSVWIAVHGALKSRFLPVVR
jgi:hypothetical protein